MKLISNMKIDLSQPGFLKFIDNTIKDITFNVKTSNYFNKTKEAQLNLISITFKILMTVFDSYEIKNYDDIKTVLMLLCQKNEKIENYELADILRYIINNYDTMKSIYGNTQKSNKKNITNYKPK